jgi:hypothetical protein
MIGKLDKGQSGKGPAKCLNIVAWNVVLFSHREPKLCFCISLQKSKIKLRPSVDLCQSCI